jgi:exodeoxyribonuclease VII large subunit
VQAIQRLERHGKVDVILVARGGGSLEDLWAFNDERVARAIADCSIPIITGIGHETDFTLADFAADYRAPTPTGAAVAATPDVFEIGLDLQALQNALSATLQNRVLFYRDQLQTQTMILQRFSPQRRVYEWEQQLDQASTTLQRVIKYQQATRRLGLSHLMDKLDTADPRNMLKRGFVMLHDESSGIALHSVQQVHPDQSLRITMMDGIVLAKSEKIIQPANSGGVENEK